MRNDSQRELEDFGKMKRIEPYQFQLNAVRKIQQTVEGKTARKILVTSPPGSGKTVIIAELARRCTNKGERVLIIAQRREILAQTFRHLVGAGSSEEQIGAIYPHSNAPLDSTRPIQIASAATLITRKLAPKADTVLLDEAHHAVAQGHESILDNYADKRIVGFTATPIRMDGRGLGDIFDELIVAALPSKLILDRKLAKPKCFTVPDDFLPNLSKIKRAMGDYVINQLNERMNRRVLVGNIVEHYKERADGKTAIVFAVSLEHSRHIVQSFKNAGIEAEHIDGNMPISERDAIVFRLRNNITKVVSNVGILHEGFDLPRTYAVILARPTMSLALYLQQTGRALRRFGNISPIILDHAKNVIKFGLPEADRDYSLHTSVKMQKAVEPVKVCKKCQAILPSHCMKCTECGYVFRHEAIVPIEDNSSLEELIKEKKENLRQKLESFLKKKGKQDPDWVNRVLEIWSAYNSEAA